MLIRGGSGMPRIHTSLGHWPFGLSVRGRPHLGTHVIELVATSPEVAGAIELVETTMNSESPEQDLDNWHRV